MPPGRYAWRVKWIRLFVSDVVVAMLSVLLWVFGMVSGTIGTSPVHWAIAWVGPALLIVGLGGILLGGRGAAK